MKAKLEFDLPEDECQFRIASTAMDWALTVLDIDNEIRRMIKYGDLKDETVEELQTLRDSLSDIMYFRCVNLDMID